MGEEGVCAPFRFLFLLMMGGRTVVLDPLHPAIGLINARTSSHVIPYIGISIFGIFQIPRLNIEKAFS